MKAVFFLPVILFFSIPVISQEDGDSIKTYELNEVVVTGTKTEVSRNLLPVALSVVNRERISESSESALLPVLSEEVPGLFISERGVTGFGVSSGAAGQISVRGIGGSPNTQVLVLLNGNPQYMGIFGHPLPDAYRATDVSRVEVIRGPASTLYGSNAMGGVINIITKEAEKDGISASLGTSYGSYNTWKYFLNTGYRKKNFSVFGGLNHDQSDGHRDFSKFNITNGYIRSSYQLNEHFKLDGDFSLAGFMAQDPGPEGGSVGQEADILRGMGAISFDNRFDKVNGSIRIFYNGGVHDISDGFHSADVNYGIVAYESMELFKGNTITLGVDYKHFGGMAENPLAMGGAGLIFGDTSIYEVATYAFVQQTLFAKLTINGGFRMEYNEVFGYEPVPTIGANYRFKTNTILKMLASKGFRSPTIREMFFATPWWPVPNTDLAPERLMNYEAGLSQSFYKDALQFELNLYTNMGDNLIQTVVQQGTPTYFNSGEFHNTGIEFSVKARPFHTLTLHANYSYIDMETPVLVTPEHKLFASAGYVWKSVTFNLSWQYIDGLYLVTGANPVTENYSLLNSRIGYKISKFGEIYVKAENLLDKAYTINYGYPMPGILAYGGINVNF